MLWQNKSYDLVNYLEIVIGIMALICLISLLWSWYRPKRYNCFNSISFLGKLIVCFDLYLLLDKLIHLIMSFYKAYLHYHKYNIYDLILLSSDIMLTIILIFSTYLFICSLEHLLKHQKSKMSNIMLKRVFKSYNCLMVVYIFKDVVLKIIYDFLVEVKKINLLYHPYTINNLMVTIVLMLLLGLVINFYKKTM
ncbi:hypothetical protein [Thomasclavelia sp.]